jgi:DNA-binding PadR family transcriptional regulator
MAEENGVLGTHRQELRRGTVVLACLLALRSPGYGYGLLKTLDAAGIPSDGNTIYPLLRRLEERGLLESEWNTEDSRPRKFYRTSSAGSELASQLMTDMSTLTASLKKLNDGGNR